MSAKIIVLEDIREGFFLKNLALAPSGKVNFVGVSDFIGDRRNSRDDCPNSYITQSLG